MTDVQIAELKTLHALKEQIKTLEAQAAELQTRTIDAIFAEGLLAYTLPGAFKVAVQSRKSPDTVVKELLIAHGVDPDVVEKSTRVGTTSAPFLRFYPVKES